MASKIEKIHIIELMVKRKPQKILDPLALALVVFLHITTDTTVNSIPAMNQTIRSLFLYFSVCIIAAAIRDTDKNIVSTGNSYKASIVAGKLTSLSMHSLNAKDMQSIKIGSITSKCIFIFFGLMITEIPIILFFLRIRSLMPPWWVY